MKNHRLLKNSYAAWNYESWNDSVKAVGLPAYVLSLLICEQDTFQIQVRSVTDWGSPTGALQTKATSCQHC